MILVRLLIACSGGGADTNVSDSDVSDSDVLHPLVPDAYQYLWNTDGCTTDQGEPGAQVYVLADGRVENDGRMTVAETWYWFFVEPGWDGDCRDVFDITGSRVLGGDPFLCPECEEKYVVQRALEPGDGNGCERSYNVEFDVSAVPADGTYDADLLFDTYVDDQANDDNLIRVVNANVDDDGEYVQHEWGSGKLVPDNPASGLRNPGRYSWLHDLCVKAD